MREARGSMMLLGEEVGVHIPRHLQALIAEIPGVGAAFAAMLPIVGVVAAIGIIGKLIEKAAEAKEKLAESGANMALEVQEGFNRLDDKLLEVGIRADELAGNHLNALHERLLLIDHATLRDIASEFDKLAKAADGTFAALETHWYQMHVGSEGAKHALAEFKTQYDMLLATGKDKEASDLLHGTLESAQKALKTMETAGFVARGMGEVSKEGIESQKALIAILDAQIEREQKLQAINSGEKQNTKTEYAQQEEREQQAAAEVRERAFQKQIEQERRVSKERTELAKKTAEELIKIQDAEMKATESIQEQANHRYQQLNEENMKNAVAIAKLQESAEEESARHRLAMHEATIRQTADADIKAAQERLKTDIDAINQEEALLDKSDQEYLVKLQAFENKKLQLIEQTNNQIAKINDIAQEKEIQVLTQAENRIGSIMAQTAAKSILENKNMARGFEQAGAQMLQAALTNALQIETVQGRKRLSDAKTAAANVYATVSDWPVVGPFLAPELAAAAFAGVMAFAEGGEVPGVGTGDIVPAMLTPGETVVTKQLTQDVKNNQGREGRGHTFHFAPTVSAVDAEGIDRVLQKHQAKFVAFTLSTLRKHNRG